MRDKIKAFYYPDFWPARSTMVKSILLFDEIHFMDRPSFTFYRGGTFGLLGAASPMRRYEKSFRDEGVPVYVHPAPGGPVTGALLKQIESDIADKQFLVRFQSGLGSSDHFRDLQIPPGNYGDGRTNLTVAADLLKVNLDEIADPLEALDRLEVPPFDTSTSDGRVKFLVRETMALSAKLNYALHLNSKEGFTPFADAKPFQILLAAKYARALTHLGAAGGLKIHPTDLCLSVLDEVIPDEHLEKLKIIDVVRYRRESAGAREAFLEYIAGLQAKLGKIAIEEDYSKTITRIIETEILPAAREFRNKLQSIHEKLFGAITKDSLIVLGGGATAIQVFGDLSWATLVALGGTVGASVGRAAIDAFLEARTTRRECAVSCLLDVPNRG